MLKSFTIARQKWLFPGGDINCLIIVFTRYVHKITGFPPFDRLMVLSLSKDLRGNDGGEVNYETVDIYVISAVFGKVSLYSGQIRLAMPALNDPYK